jgi:hypothetical protein
MFVTAGFIIGFDSERQSVADAMVQFVEDCAIPLAMVGLLYALPNTQLTRRLAKEGRLYEGHDVMRPDRSGDQCLLGINFEPKRPMRDILTDYRQILDNLYSPEAFAGRLRRLSDLLNRSNSRRRPPKGDIKLRSGAAEHFNRIINHMPEARAAFQETMRYCAATNPRALRFIVLMMGIYLHLGPLSRHVIATMDDRIAAQDTPRLSMPPVAQEARTGAAF